MSARLVTIRFFWAFTISELAPKRIIRCRTSHELNRACWFSRPSGKDANLVAGWRSEIVCRGVR